MERRSFLAALLAVLSSPLSLLGRNASSGLPPGTARGHPLLTSEAKERFRRDYVLEHAARLRRQEAETFLVAQHLAEHGHPFLITEIKNT